MTERRRLHQALVRNEQAQHCWCPSTEHGHEKRACQHQSVPNTSMCRVCATKFTEAWAEELGYE